MVSTANDCWPTADVDTFAVALTLAELAIFLLEQIIPVFCDKGKNGAMESSSVPM